MPIQKRLQPKWVLLAMRRSPSSFAAGSVRTCPAVAWTNYCARFWEWDLDRWSSRGPVEEIRTESPPRLSPDLLLVTSLGSPAGSYIEVGLGPCLSHFSHVDLKPLRKLAFLQG